MTTMLRSDEARDRAATVGERNSIRRALRREAAWRRRRSVVLLKTYLERQPPQLQVGAATASAQSPNRVGGISSSGEDIWSGGLKRAGSTSVHSLTAKSARAAAAAEGARDGVDDDLLLRRVLEGVADLAAREEALFRLIVTFL